MLPHFSVFYNRMVYLWTHYLVWFAYFTEDVMLTLKSP